MTKQYFINYSIIFICIFTTILFVDYWSKPSREARTAKAATNWTHRERWTFTETNVEIEIDLRPVMGGPWPEATLIMINCMAIETTNGFHMVFPESHE